ncbi:MAG: hypothetical protein ACI9DC_000771 [Gammaproteobacteria bacterium]|jgi:hypothetical protein
MLIGLLEKIRFVHNGKNDWLKLALWEIFLDPSEASLAK